MPKEVVLVILKRIIGKNNGYYYYQKFGDFGYERIGKEFYEQELLYHQSDLKNKKEEAGYIIYAEYDYVREYIEESQEPQVHLNPASSSACPACQANLLQARVEMPKFLLPTIVIGFILLFIKIALGLLVIFAAIIISLVKSKKILYCLLCKHKIK